MEQLVPTVPLAVYSPVEVMVPHFAVHVTGMFAVNCWVLPCGVFADGGVIVIGDVTVTLAVTLPLPLVAVALTVHVAVAYRGALKSPAEEMEPQVCDHVDGALAVNCWVAFSFSVAEVGETVTARQGIPRKRRKKTTKIRTGGKGNIWISNV